MNKKILIILVAITILGVGFVKTSFAFAQETSQNPVSSLVQKITDKFGLNKDEVQKVFDADRDEMKAEMEKRKEDRLVALVTKGTITEAQKTLILGKIAELKKQRESEKDSFKSLSADERKTKMEAQKTSLEKWATDNGIDLKYLMNFGGGGHKGPRMPMK